MQLETGDSILAYSTRIDGGKTTSILKVIANSIIVYETTYELDTSIADYRLLQHEKIQDQAKHLMFDLNKNDYILLSKQCKTLIEDAFSNIDIKKKHIQSLFFHYAILNTKMRSVSSSNGVYECLPHPGYILSKTFFWCQEDYLVGVDLIKEVYKSHPELLKDKKNVDLFNYINSVKEKFIPYDKIYAFTITKENYLLALKRIVERNKILSENKNTVNVVAGDCSWWCPIGCGSDLGCCGNYSGCCFYASPECYIHDRLCINCTPSWFCLDGCIPG